MYCRMMPMHWRKSSSVTSTVSVLFLFESIRNFISQINVRLRLLLLINLLRAESVLIKRRSLWRRVLFRSDWSDMILSDSIRFKITIQRWGAHSIHLTYMSLFDFDCALKIKRRSARASGRRRTVDARGCQAADGRHGGALSARTVSYKFLWWISLWVTSKALSGSRSFSI